MVLALATRGALSFETRILFGQLAFALPPHGPRSPTAKGMESKGLRARVRSRKTSPVSPVMSPGSLTVRPSRCTSSRRRLTPGRANRDEHLRVEDDEEAPSEERSRSRPGASCWSAVSNCAGASHSTYPWEDASTIGVNPTTVVAVRSPPLVTLHGNLTRPCQCIHAPHYLRPFQNPPLIQTDRDQKPKGGTGDDATLCGRYMGACP